MKTFVLILHIIISFVIIFSILFQPAKVEGLSSAITGGAETFFGRNKGRTIESKLSKVTTISMILFVITSITLVLYK